MAGTDGAARTDGAAAGEDMQTPRAEVAQEVPALGNRAGEAGFVHGLLSAVPIALGYAPIAFAFGVAATGQGLSGGEAFVLSLIIYAGASQFLALALITGGAPIVIAALTLVAMNLRHVLYGPTLIARAADRAGGAPVPRGHAWIWSFGLTDEVFGAALGHLARGDRFSETFMIGLGAGAYAAWLGGTALGAYAGAGALAGFPVIEGALGFMLPALFLALLLSILGGRQIPVIAAAAVAAVAVSPIWGGTAGIMAGMVTGALMGVMQRGQRHAD